MNNGTPNNTDNNKIVASFDAARTISPINIIIIANTLFFNVSCFI